MSVSTASAQTPPQSGWSFEKNFADSPASETSSQNYHFESVEKVRIAPRSTTVLEMAKKAALSSFDERYMSSEEALSPLEQEADLSDDGEFEDIDDYLDDGEAGPFTSLEVKGCDMAIAVCIISVGKPKIIDLPGLLTPTSSRSSRSPSDPVTSRTTSFPIKTTSSPSPLISLLAPPTFPPMPTRLSATSFADLLPASARTSVTSKPTNISSETNPRPTSLPPQPEPDHLSKPVLAASFLETDPFAMSAQRNRLQQSRLRSFSQKFTRRPSQPLESIKAAPLVPPLQMPAAPVAPPWPKVSFLARKDSGYADEPEKQTPQQQPSIAVTTTKIGAGGAGAKMVPRGAAEREPSAHLLEFLEEDEKRNKGWTGRRRRSLVGLGIVGS